MPKFDAHCHLQDLRLVDRVDDVLGECTALGIESLHVNGTSEKDWERVARLSKRSGHVSPSFGLHPWFVKERSKDWKERLLEYWSDPRAQVGEIGLDRWVQDYDIGEQLEVFRWQLVKAEELNKACTIHCLKAFGLLHSVLKEETHLPRKGFLLHSYGGSAEMIKSFVSMGAYFSFSAYFSLDRKFKQREVFKEVPLERLLIESDAPDMLGDLSLAMHSPKGPQGESINDPRNIVAIYRYAAEMLGVCEAELELQVADNYKRLFGA